MKKIKVPQVRKKTNKVPSNKPLPGAGHFPVVGIGASAGGLAAFEAFFSGMPADTDPGMAFVLVQHLAPDHKSLLSELIRRCTRMQVYEVEDGMVVKPNCAYIIPPGCDMAFLSGCLHLLKPDAPRGQRLPIDFFFRSLAHDQHERAICIVLSGTGSDGSLGVRAIKGEGGMVMVQNPGSSEYDGMPRSAIATGLVDYELPPAEMAAKLIAYVAHAFGRPRVSATAVVPHSSSPLTKIFILLRAQTGHDFSLYKPSTIQRRIERRLAVNQVDTLESYVKFLQQTPAEVEALFRDLLIGVTSFFRDPEAFAELEQQIIPRLFAGKLAGATVRVWVPGCSTGEEAYSIAMLLQEYQYAHKRSFTVQVFATDIDSQAIATARLGVYPLSIASDVGPKRLSRFFAMAPDSSTYRIQRDIRDMLVFSEHDVIKNPPFSRLDLISCRNLLIYMGGELQKKLMPLFHYALNKDGFLFLGTSETVGDHPDLFLPLERKLKLYQRKQHAYGSKREMLGSLLPPLMALGLSAPRAIGKQAPVEKLPLRELAVQALLEQVFAIGALVNGQGDILYLHGRTGQYLELAQGETGVSNILKMAREGLQHELTTALHKAVTNKERIHCPGVRVDANGLPGCVDLTICPVETSGASLFLVVLEDVPPAPEGLNPVAEADASIATLRHELRAKEEYLQTANEELETANEELKSANEELQSVNEEMQSTNEEVETAKEEMQSVNEELITVNNELQTKVSELSQANNDMNNLLAGTGIGTVFVDHSLHIMRFTPDSTRIINLILSDVGRPVGHIVSNLVSYDTLVEDVQAVLDTLIPREKEVQTRSGNWYTMHIQPYRTIGNVIEGAVLTFVDISKMKQTQEMLRKANELMRLAVVVRDAHDAMTVQDLEGLTLAWNPGAERLYGWSESEALLMNVRERIPEEQRKDALARVYQLSQAEVLEPCQTRRLARDGSIVEISLISTALLDESGQMYAIATTERPSQPRPGDIRA